jgi:hypothetical protein
MTEETTAPKTIEQKLIELFQNTINTIDESESPETKESLDFFLESIMKEDKSSTQVKIQVPEKGLIPTVSTSIIRTAKTIQDDTDRKLKEIVNDEPTNYKKEYVATININQNQK